MTIVSDQALQNKSQYGFAPLAIARIKGAQRANQIAIYLIYAAIVAFMVFGTIASIKAFHDNQLLYQLFYNLPYALVAITIPITIYDALVIYRYRLNQPSMIAMSIGVAFLFKVSFKRFFNFLETKEDSEIVEEA